MLLVYGIALGIGLGATALQAFAGHDASVGDHDVGHDLHGASGAGEIWTIVASVRFWAFALLAFGLVGTLGSLFGVAHEAVLLVVAIAAGLTSGAGAAVVVRRLVTHAATSNASRGELVGKLGKVVVPIGETWRGKVRVEIRGTMIDVPARASEAIDAGAHVVVEDDDDGVAVVSRAPEEIAR